MTSQIARYMGPTWAHLGLVGPRWSPCKPYEPCYLGWRSMQAISSDVTDFALQNIPLSPHHSGDYNTVNSAWNFRLLPGYTIISCHNCKDGISETSTGRWRVNSIGIRIVGIRRSNAHLIIKSGFPKQTS